MGMININRKIHKIGQGAFYTENFEYFNDKPFNVVYDCGSCWDGKSKSIDYYSSTKANHPFLNILNNYLSDSKNKIDLLFISHFHHDHINGVKYLLDHIKQPGQKVKLYLPWMNTDMKIYFFLSNVQDEGGYGENTNIYIDWLYQLFFTNLENAEKIEVISNGEDRDDNNSYHISGTPIEIPNDWHPIWALIPVVYIDKSLEKELKSFANELKTKITDISQDNLIDNIKTNWDKINKVLEKHKKIKKEYANNLSMMLYSGPYHHYAPYRYRTRLISRINIPHYEDIPYRMYNRRTRYFEDLPACLYIGDMEKKEAFDELKNNLKGLMNNVGLLQLSHHGDENQMNDILTKLHPINAFCCYGTQNTYHHPEWSTMDKYMRLGTNVFPINEDSPSGIELRIDFWF